ncbi:hypothetical protein ACO0LF_30500 [Undibacterium sp. Di27W]|uniref:hypothetical protein n=1 Tax=Undibacterium sp. Di27W TaxID=3413036 RepID=UPI003BF00B16
MKRHAQPALGTLVEISISDAVDAVLDDGRLQAAFHAGFTAVHTIHGLMSFHSPDSDISRYNRAAVGSVIDIHPLEHWAMQAHGAFIIPLSFLACCLLFQRMRRAHRALRNHYSGWSMLLTLLALTMLCPVLLR